MMMTRQASHFVMIFVYVFVSASLSATATAAPEAELKKCAKNADCASVTRYTCAREKGICLNADDALRNLTKCERCVTNSTCGGIANYCRGPPLPICQTCGQNVVLKAATMCNDRTNTVANTNITATTAPSETETYIHNRNAPTTASCVATSWLRHHRLTNAFIRHTGTSPVLCIPGLPCATAGHLLRECGSDTQKSCQLLSYLEVCLQHPQLGCVSSIMPVSQLSHTFDWSWVQVSIGSANSATSTGHQKDNQHPLQFTLTLTSLSIHPTSSPFSIPYPCNIR